MIHLFEILKRKAKFKPMKWKDLELALTSIQAHDLNQDSLSWKIGSNLERSLLISQLNGAFL